MFQKFDEDDEEKDNDLDVDPLVTAGKVQKCVENPVRVLHAKRQQK